ncbi:MAG: sigma-70 family RNA polymerase sigma factor [candidate division Zixibacteria bacterium]|nr:sigma-70 family RNA polymerase sigma factor [candidate division Zixibacteria bacterium]
MSRNIGEENQPKPVNREGSPKTERELVEAVQNGDTKAFGKLVRLNQKRLFRYIYGLVGSFDETEDIVQEAFVRAFNNIKTFRTQYAFYPWLSTIARNLAYNHISREEKKESLDRLQEKGYDPQSVDLGPLENLVEGEGRQRFFKAVMAMPVKYRTVFVLRHFEQMDYGQIASYLKIPPGTVDSRLYRARQFLLDELKEMLE